MPRCRSVLFHPWLHFFFFVVLLDDAFIVILVKYLDIVLCLYLCKWKKVFCLVGVGIDYIQFVGKEVNVVEEVLRLFPAIVESDSKGGPEVLHELRPVNVDLGVLTNAYSIVRK